MEQITSGKKTVQKIAGVEVHNKYGKRRRQKIKKLQYIMKIITQEEGNTELDGNVEHKMCFLFFVFFNRTYFLF
jgi:hypothetical protein